MNMPPEEEPALRIWRIPPRLLDDRRLNAQHNEIHIALNAMGRVLTGQGGSGWSSATNKQIAPWFGKRSALVSYHDRIILPELVRRGKEDPYPALHFSPIIGGPTPEAVIRKLRRLYRGFDKMPLEERRRRAAVLMSNRAPSPFAIPDDIPEEERGFNFWDHVTWDMVLLDCRHLIEKHLRDAALVDLAVRTGERTRIIRPTGHDPRAIILVFHRAISHVYGIDPNDREHLQLAAFKLTSEKLLKEPSHNKLTPTQRRELRSLKLVAA
jgi:hypothetical protein